MRLLFSTLLLGTTTLLSAQTLHIDAIKSKLEYTRQTVETISPKKLKALIDQDVDDLYILDIREPDQVGHGEIFHINLVQVTRGYLEFKIERAIPNKKAQVVIYCCSGKRSLLAAKALEDMGYKNVRSLEGGLRNWVDSGMPLDTVYGEMVLH